MSYTILVKYHDSPPSSAMWLILPPLFKKRGEDRAFDVSSVERLSGFGVSKKYYNKLV